MIDEERTFKEFGYTSDMLTYGSHRRVWRICIGCGKEDDVEYCNYVYGQVKCMSCASSGRILSEKTKKKLSIANKGKVFSNIHRERLSNASLKRGPFNIEYFQDVQNVIDDGGINELKTFNDFGYYSIDLTRGSDRKVWRICEIGGEESKICYKKYVMGQKSCKACIQKGNRHPMYGKRHSQKSKEQMSAKHQNIAYDEWTEFSYKHLYAKDFNETLKMYIRAKYSGRCFICNKTTIENKKELPVHHIDMDKQNTSEQNLIPLCNECHPTTHNNLMIARLQYILNEAIHNE